MTDALDPEPLLRALPEAGVRHVSIGGFAVNATGSSAPPKDLHIVPDPAPTQPGSPGVAATRARRTARRRGDVDPDEFPYDQRSVEHLTAGASFRLRTRLGDLDGEHAYAELSRHAIEGVLDGIPLRVCGPSRLIAVERRRPPARSRRLQRLGA